MNKWSIIQKRNSITEAKTYYPPLVIFLKKEKKSVKIVETIRITIKRKREEALCERNVIKVAKFDWSAAISNQEK